MKKTTLALMVLVISGCASSGVVPAGRNTFILSKVSAACGFGSPDALKSDLYREAAASCTPQTDFEPSEFTGTNGIPAVRCASAQLTFKCSPK